MGERVGGAAAEATIGAVLCGGRSSRFGTDKAVADAGGVLLGRRVIDALRAGGADPVVAVGGTAGTALGVPTLPDRYPDEGPLAALATVLRWADRGVVVVAPCDLPLLRAEHVEALVEAATADRAAIATRDGRPQPSLGCWPAGWGRQLVASIGSGARAWRAGLEVGPWIGVELPAEAVADADTPARLEELLRQP